MSVAPAAPDADHSAHPGPLPAPHQPPVAGELFALPAEIDDFSSKGGITMNRTLLAVMVGTLLPMTTIFAAGPFDGEWKGSFRGAGGQCRPQEMTLTVTDGKLTGHRDIPAMGSRNFGGMIASDGTITGAGGRLEGKVSGDSAVVMFHADPPCGVITFPLQKVK